MPPFEKVISISPSNVPSFVSVPAGKLVVTCPPDALVTVHVRVDSTVVVPTSLIRSLTVAPVKPIAEQVSLSLESNVCPVAAVEESFCKRQLR